MNQLLVSRLDAQRGDYLPTYDKPITPEDLHIRKLDEWLVAWFLVHYWNVMQYGGAWPDSRPEEIPTRGGYLRYAFFDSTVRCVAVVTGRLKKCGRDGYFAWLYYGCDCEIEDIARQFRRRESAVIKRINNVLRYCSGWREKTIPYEAFVRRGARNGTILHT